MRSIANFVVFAGILTSTSLGADLLWNNYQGVNGYDGDTFLSSERSTIIGDSWTVDDAVLGSPIIAQELTWIGLRDSSEDPYAADFIILNHDLSVLSTMADVPFALNDLGTGPGGLSIYEATLQIPDVAISAGHYYFGARLADADQGRNYFATAGDGNLLGETMGMFKGESFGFDDWTPVDQVLASGSPSDFAFQVYGTVVPEPATLALLAIGAVVGIARRRR